MSGGDVEARIAAMEQDFERRKQEINRQYAENKRLEDEAKGRSEETCCWQITKVLQYIFGVTIGLYSVFITLYGLVNRQSGTSDFLHPVVSLLCLALLITTLAFCEGTQIALMLLEKVPARDLPEGIFCSNRVKMTHALAQANTERYLVGRQIFTTGIVFLIAKLIYMKPEYAAFVEANLGFLGNPVLINIFVYTGLSGALMVLAFGQLVPQLIVTTSPIQQYQLFPTYEIIVVQLFCERLGLGYMANILRDFTRWAFGLKDEPFGVGSGVEISRAGTSKSEEKQEMTAFVRFWTEVPTWNRAIQYVVGVVVFGGSIVLTLMNVLGGYSDFTRIEWVTSDTEGFCKNFAGEQLARYTDLAGCTLNEPIGLAACTINNEAAVAADFAEASADAPVTVVYNDGTTAAQRNVIGVNADPADGSIISLVIQTNTWVGKKLNYDTNADGGWIATDGDIPVWIQLVFFIPLSNIAMGFLEGTQIAILALEKAPARTIKRMYRQAYFGHKLTQQRDNVRRYLLGRQFLVVFVDFIAAHTMGLGGLGILVPVSQLYPQLLAATNPMWFMGVFGSKFILLMALFMEFCGFCHFSWALFLIFFTIRSVIKDGAQSNEVGSVGQAVDISGAMADGVETPTDIDELRQIVVDQQERINNLQRQIGVGTQEPLELEG